MVAKIECASLLQDDKENWRCGMMGSLGCFQQLSHGVAHVEKKIGDAHRDDTVVISSGMRMYYLRLKI